MQAVVLFAYSRVQVQKVVNSSYNIQVTFNAADKPSHHGNAIFIVNFKGVSQLSYLNHKVEG
jgi:hypothetical protein